MSMGVLLDRLIEASAHQARFREWADEAHCKKNMNDNKRVKAMYQKEAERWEHHAEKQAEGVREIKQMALDRYMDHANVRVTDVRTGEHDRQEGSE